MYTNSHCANNRVIIIDILNSTYTILTDDIRNNTNTTVTITSTGTSPITYLTNDISLSINEGALAWFNYLEDNVTCQTGTSYAVAYTVVNLDYSPVTWVYVSTDLGEIWVDATSNTQFTGSGIYQLYVQTGITFTSSSPNYVYNNLTITVIMWELENWDTCNTDFTKWLVCDEGYRDYDNSYTCQSTQIPPAVAMAQSMGTGAVGLGAWFSFISTIIKFSSTQALFSLIDQFQLLFFIPLIGVYVSPNIYKYLEGMEMMSYHINYDFSQFYYLNFLYRYFYFPQSSLYLGNIGYPSGSTVINQIEIFIVLGVLIIVQMFWVLHYWIYKNPIFDSWYKKLFRFAHKKFLFAIYIRMFIEAFLKFLLSSMIEVNNFDISSGQKRNSLIFAGIVILLCILFFILCCVTLWKMSNGKDCSTVDEFFSPNKQTFRSRLYIITYFLKRILIITIIWWFKFLEIKYRIITIALMQIAISFYFVTTMPFLELKSNIIECIMEVYNTIILCSLWYFYTKERWSKMYESCFIGSATFMFILLSILSFISLFVTCWQMCWKCKIILDTFTCQILRIDHIYFV